MSDEEDLPKYLPKYDLFANYRKVKPRRSRMNRRTLLTTAFAGATVSMLRGEFEAQAPPAGGWTIKPLPFDPKTLKGISEKLIVSHHDNNYAGAARRIGQIQQMLSGLPNNAPGFQVKGLKMEELIATNSAILHEEYFGNLGAMGRPPVTSSKSSPRISAASTIGNRV